MIFIKLEYLSQFIRGREQDNYVGRSQVNLMCALLWHLAFVQHLVHERVSTMTWHEEDLHLRSLLLPRLAAEITELRDCLRESQRYLRQQIGRLKDRAEQQVKARNSQEALQERGSWFTIEWMRTIIQALDAEGWARMNRMKTILNTLSVQEFLETQSQRRAQFDWLRDWIIFSLFVDIPPMRPQNGELQILKSPEPAGSRQTNGLLFLKSRISLQVVQFKNATFMGEHVIDLPKGLEEKLLTYMHWIRPAYAFQLQNEKEIEDEEAEREEEHSDEEHWPTSTTSSSTIIRQHLQLRAEVPEWHAQSSWLFLKAGNQPVRRIGTVWFKFVFENTGQRTNLRVWRKVAETTSAQQNSVIQQQTLSGALLHQHKTGQEYYVTHNPQAKSKEIHKVWNALLDQVFIKYLNNLKNINKLIIFINNRNMKKMKQGHKLIDLLDLIFN